MIPEEVSSQEGTYTTAKATEKAITTTCHVSSTPESIMLSNTCDYVCSVPKTGSCKVKLAAPVKRGSMSATLSEGKFCGKASWHNKLPVKPLPKVGCRSLWPFSNLPRASCNSLSSESIEDTSLPGDLNNNEASGRDKELCSDQYNEAYRSTGESCTHGVSPSPQAAQRDLTNYSDMFEQPLIHEVKNFVVVDNAPVIAHGLSESNCTQQLPAVDGKDVSSFRSPRYISTADVPHAKEIFSPQGCAVESRSVLLESEKTDFDSKNASDYTSQHSTSELTTSAESSLLEKGNAFYCGSFEDNAVVTCMQKSLTESLLLAEISCSEPVFGKTSCATSSGTSSLTSAKGVEELRAADKRSKEDMRMFLISRSADDASALADMGTCSDLTTTSHFPSHLASFADKLTDWLNEMSEQRYAIPAVSHNCRLRSGSSQACDFENGDLNHGTDLITSNVRRRDLSETPGSELCIDCTRFNAAPRPKVELLETTCEHLSSRSLSVFENAEGVTTSPSCRVLDPVTCKLSSVERTGASLASSPPGLRNKPNSKIRTNENLKNEIGFTKRSDATKARKGTSTPFPACARKIKHTSDSAPDIPGTVKSPFFTQKRSSSRKLVSSQGFSPESRSAVESNLCARGSETAIAGSSTENHRAQQTKCKTNANSTKKGKNCVRHPSKKTPENKLKLANSTGKNTPPTFTNRSTQKNPTTGKGKTHPVKGDSKAKWKKPDVGKCEPTLPTTRSKIPAPSLHAQKTVGARLPSRRSPRIVRSSLSLAHLQAAAANCSRQTTDMRRSLGKTRSSCDLLLTDETERSQITKPTKVNSRDCSEIGMSARECGTAGSTAKPAKWCGTNPAAVNSTETSAPIPATTTTCQNLSSISVQEVTTRGTVHSTIQSIVHHLMKQPHLHQNKPLCSPSLAALRKKPSRVDQVRETGFFLRSDISITATERKKVNSLPSTSVNRSSMLSERRSASLSDVFYDTTTDDVQSSVTAGLQIDSDASAQLNNDRLPKQPLSPDNLLLSSQHFNLKHQTPTYIGYSPPIMTPTGTFDLDNSHCVPKSSERRTFSLQCQTSEENKAGDMPDTPSIPNGLSDLVPSGEQRSMAIDNEIKKEICEKLQEIVESVDRLLCPQNLNLLNERDSSVMTPSEQPGEVGTSYLPVDCRNVVSATEDSALVPLPSLDSSTQTVANVLNCDSSLSDPKVRKQLAAPTKPPRNNCPSVRYRATDGTLPGSTEPVEVKNAEKAEKAEKAILPHADGPVASPTILPYFPLFTTFPRPSPHTASAHILSPTLVPVQIGGGSPSVSAIAAFVWPGMPGQLGPAFVDASDLSQSQTSDDVAEPQALPGNEGKTGVQTEVAACDPAPTLASELAKKTIAEKQDSASRLVVSQVLLMPANPVAPSHTLLSASSARTNQAPSNEKTKKPVLKRRRSFPGIALSSSTVAKARLHRRYAGFLARNYPAANPARRPPASQTINFSYPAPRLQPERRARFVRSSLSSDVVYQTVGQKNRPPVFMTKPEVNGRCDFFGHNWYSC